MKMKRVLFFTVVAVIAFSAFACVSAPVGPPDIGGRVAEGATRYPSRLYLIEIDLYAQTHVPAYIFPGNNVPAAKFEVDFSIKNFQFTMPTVFDDMENSVVFRLYKWNETYKETVKEDPVVQIFKKNIKNNELVVFEVDDGIAPPGTYLWTMSEGKSKDPYACVAIWSEPDKDSQYKKNAVFYYNGYETDEFFYKVIVGGVKE